MSWRTSVSDLIMSGEYWQLTGVLALIDDRWYAEVSPKSMGGQEMKEKEECHKASLR